MTIPLEQMDTSEKTCKVKYDGREWDVVHLVIEDQKFYAMLAGGSLIEVKKDVFLELQTALRSIFSRGHFFK